MRFLTLLWLTYRLARRRGFRHGYDLATRQADERRRIDALGYFLDGLTAIVRVREVKP